MTEGLGIMVLFVYFLNKFYRYTTIINLCAVISWYIRMVNYSAAGINEHAHSLYVPFLLGDEGNCTSE